MEPNSKAEEGAAKVAAASKEKLSKFSESAKNVFQDGKKTTAIITAVALIFATVIVIMLWSSSPRYRPLYSPTSNYDSSKILEMLDESRIDYQLSPSDGNVMVLESKVYEIRKILAARGLQEEIPVGMELITENSSLGQSQFIEEAKYRYALEGELAKSIVTFQSVSYARVHLSVPKTTKYVRNADTVQATASVIVNLVDGQDLRPAQIDSIINLVAGSSAALKKENISIVDQFGRLLSDESSVGDYVMSTSKQQDYRAQMESYLRTQAADILTPIYGPSNFRVRVNADIDFTQKEETQESYGDPVVRSEVLLENRGASQMTLGVPGSLSNTPPITDADAVSARGGQQTRSEVKRDYAVSGRVVHKKHQNGLVQGLTVSVVLNGEFIDSDEMPTELVEISDLVKNAVGFSGERGDQFKISQLPFQSVVEIAKVELKWYEQQDVVTLARYLVSLILGLALVFIGLKPLVRFMINGTSKPQSEVIEGSAAEMANDEAKMKQDEYLRSLGISSGGLGAFDIDLPDSESPIQDQIQHAQKLVERDADRAIEVFKTWMATK
ncbi:flagellar M-ring protein FliF (plasmid) [Vibrio breoganii]|uniref:Flagellar M-ring protein n=2 Tax=Vibrio TaxID=662 RepID=A0AAN1CUH4_9VIBR|nr:flagellar basal-body MS-ring/collar protein FliF [Vibrio breoganii]ANO35299.1 flagellar M-ring protein FliF [Vibrio breoganii]